MDTETIESTIEMPSGSVRRVPLDKVRWWGNARQEFDSAELAGLADSLRDTGDPLQFPIGWMEGDVFVGFIGERRYRATLLRRDRGEDVVSMPVRVIERPSERDALKWGLVENVQRAPLKPTEEAAWVQRMLDLTHEGSGQPLFSLNSLAEELGKPISRLVYLRGVLDAPREAREMLDRGEVDIETVGRIGRSPAGVREAMAQRLLFGPTGAVKQAEARRIIADEFRRDLRQADFPRSAADLDGLPACVACEWYGGNRSDLAGEAAKHACLDPSCFARKQRAHALAERARLAAGGWDVRLVPDEEAAGLFLPGGELNPTCAYVDLAARPVPYFLSESGRRSGTVPRWAEALEGVCPRVHVAWDGEGRKHELVEAALALPAALQGPKAAYFRAEAGADLLSGEERAALAAQRNAEARVRREAALEGGWACFEALSGLEWDWHQLFSVLELVGDELLKPEDFAFLCDVLERDMPRERRTARGFYEWLRSCGVDLDGLMAVLVLMLQARRVRYEGFARWTEEGPMADLCAAAGVDPQRWADRWNAAGVETRETGA